MDSPLPKPRILPGEVKKPIPTPRRSTRRIDDCNNTASEQPKEDHFNSFSRRVSSLSNASKQIAGDIGQLVQDRKKAVIEGTRQSVRKITRRFSSSSQEPHNSEDPTELQDEESIDIFKSIKFGSPISQTENVYNNVNNDSVSSDEGSIDLPPPSHPPPPLPDESIYDAPASITSSSNSGCSNNLHKFAHYERIFPTNPNDNNCETFADLINLQKSDGKTDDDAISSSSSWKLYDSVAGDNLNENKVYNVIDKRSKDLTNNNISECDHNSNGSGQSSVNKINSVYENHEIVSQVPVTPRASKSVIFQFDPLNNITNNIAESALGHVNDMKLLEELLQGDLYGTISNAHTIEDWSISNDSESEDVVSPPTPPMRIDSLPEEELEQVTKNGQKSRSNWFTNEKSQQQTHTENKKYSWLKQVKEVLEKAPDVVRGIKNKDNNVDRPAISVKSCVQKKGMLYKIQSGPVEDLFGEYSGRWCVLENSNFVCYSDNTCQHLKEHFRAENILSIQILQDKKYNYRYDNDDLHCFELNTTGKARGGHIYGSRSVSERRTWMQLIAESLTSRFSTKLTANYSRMGWAYVREGVSGNWVGAWIIITQRELYYAIDKQRVKKMDLRKARCIVLQSYQDTENNPRTNDKGPNMLIDCPDLVLYLRMWTARETKVWCHIIKLEAHNNGANLDQQQLTKNDIPVIVEKCINYIYAHGSMTEGIYRRAGSGSLISEILTKFGKDAFAVQLTSDLCTEHEVGTALKRFFRDLPEPLLGSSQRQYLYEVSKHSDVDEKVRMYKAALDQLPSISYKTTRKLLGHLHFISSQSAKNLMSVENLASIWGPTLMHSEYKEDASKTSHDHQRDTEVVEQLIKYYRHIFPEDPGELEKEQHMLRVLEKYSKSPQGVTKKSAGDLRIWIFTHNKEGKSFNVAIGPNKTAYEVCLELCGNIKLPVHEVVLEEIVLNDRLSRLIHHEEKVLNVVLKWGYWDEADRKDNYLTIAPLSKYWEFLIEKPLPVSGELKFADNKSKLFKLLTFQFSQGKLAYFKDKTGEILLHSWNVEDIIWYLGHESKRNPQSRWTITFIELKTHPKRTKNAPYFGNVLVWTDAASRANWLSAMLKSRYPNNLAPPPKLLSI
ncbi:arf-GAP with Rho-GAP domain, ANK repeat and PH domain-containing protein 1 [Anoplophora glabripennis]|nr:arf-GAP with Rho-GAP domain, ANK repeat and PH domain-containing protein 1 [Anoplophora glabripennis]